MAAAAYFFEQFGMPAYVVAYHEEGGAYAVAVKQIEHPGGLFGNGSVVECQVDHAAAAAVFYAPPCFGKKQSVEQRRLLDQHSGKWFRA